MRILKFGDFASVVDINEGYSFINEDEMPKEDTMEYTITKDGFMFDFTDLYVNFINKTV